MGVARRIFREEYLNVSNVLNGDAAVAVNIRQIISKTRHSRLKLSHFSLDHRNVGNRDNAVKVGVAVNAKLNGLGLGSGFGS